MAEERIADAQVRGHRAAKISGQQNCAEYGCPWNRVQYSAGQQKDSKRDRTAQRQSQVRECVDDRRGLYEFNDGVRNQEKYNQSAENAPGPEAFLRHRNSSRFGWHESFLQMSFQFGIQQICKIVSVIAAKCQLAAADLPLSPGNCPYDEQRLRPRRDRVRQRRIRRFMRKILRASEESQERAALLRDVIANRASQHRVPRLQRVEDRALRDGALDLQLHVA